VKCPVFLTHPWVRPLFIWRLNITQIKYFILVLLIICSFGCNESSNKRNAPLYILKDDAPIIRTDMSFQTIFDASPKGWYIFANDSKNYVGTIMIEKGFPIDIQFQGCCADTSIISQEINDNDFIISWSFKYLGLEESVIENPTTLYYKALITKDMFMKFNDAQDQPLSFEIQAKRITLE